MATGGGESSPVITAFPPNDVLAFQGMPRLAIRLVNRSPSTGPMLSSDEVGRCRKPLNHRSSIVGWLSPSSSIFRAPAMWSLSTLVIINISICVSAPWKLASEAAVVPTAPSIATSKARRACRNPGPTRHPKPVVARKTTSTAIAADNERSLGMAPDEHAQNRAFKLGNSVYRNHRPGVRRVKAWLPILTKARNAPRRCLMSATWHDVARRSGSGMGERDRRSATKLSSPAQSLFADFLWLRSGLVHSSLPTKHSRRSWKALDKCPISRLSRRQHGSVRLATQVVILKVPTPSTMINTPHGRYTHAHLRRPGLRVGK